MDFILMILIADIGAITFLGIVILLTYLIINKIDG